MFRDEPASSPRPLKLPAVLSVAALILAVGYFAWRGPLSMSGQRLWDYAVCASSSQVWLRGGDPYDTGAVNDNWRAQRVGLGVEDEIAWLRPIVPPTTLVVLAPFAAMRAELGAYLYLLFTTALLGAAAWCCGCWACLRGGATWLLYAASILISVPATLGLYSGNPVMLAGPLILLGLYASARRGGGGHDWLGGVMLGFGTACKVQIGVPMLVACLAVGRAKSALVACATAFVIALAGGGRMSTAGVDWWPAWKRNVAEANGPGGLNDFAASRNPDDHLNMQIPLWALSGDRTFTNVMAFALFGLAAVLSAIIVLRGRGRGASEADDRRPLQIIGLASVLLLIPVYHRTYDGVILLPVLALAMAGVSDERPIVRRLCWATLALLATLTIPAGLPGFLERRGMLPQALIESLAYRAAVVPIRAWAIYALAIVMLAMLMQQADTRQPTGEAC